MIISPTLLISDDDFDLRESLGGMFSARGFETVLAGDGREAWDVVRHRDVHLVLIDFHMPRMTGFEAMRLMKEYRRELPVILMSAEMDDALSRQVLDADAWSVHKKPVDIMKIQADVFDALRSTYNWNMAG
jgi:CheY-like chemotaxis protein